MPRGFLLHTKYAHARTKRQVAMEDKIVHRVVTFLDRTELDFLDTITKDILFSRGIKVPRSALLKEILDEFSRSYARDEASNRLFVNTVIESLKKGGLDE